MGHSPGLWSWEVWGLYGVFCGFGALETYRALGFRAFCRMGTIGGWVCLVVGQGVALQHWHCTPQFSHASKYAALSVDGEEEECGE